jgi:beta-lactam-binding protein with PASTA domain
VIPGRTLLTSLADATRPARRIGRRPRALLVPLAALLGAVLGLGIFDRIIMPGVVSQRDEVRIPSIGGRSLREATRALGEAGLEPQVTAGRSHPAVPAGAVLEVSPPVGLSVKRGRQVFVTPSLGERQNLVPDLLGHTLRMARILAGDAGLEIADLTYAATDLASPDQILAMSPEPGSPAAPDGKITLLLGRARAPVPSWMPNLIGLEGWRAVAWVRRSGFHVVTEEADGGEPGSVAHQAPPPGSPIWPGVAIRLGVSPGRAGRHRGGT